MGTLALFTDSPAALPASQSSTSGADHSQVPVIVKDPPAKRIDCMAVAGVVPEDLGGRYRKTLRSSAGGFSRFGLERCDSSLT